MAKESVLRSRSQHMHTDSFRKGSHKQVSLLAGSTLQVRLNIASSSAREKRIMVGRPWGQVKGLFVSRS